MNNILLLKKEHGQILNILTRIEQEKDSQKMDVYKVIKLLENFDELWGEHEKKEEKFFNLRNVRNKSFPTETMLLDQHRALESHWNIIERAMQSRNEGQIIAALETDGKALIEKLKHHINVENSYFDSLELMGITQAKQNNF